MSGHTFTFEEFEAQLAYVLQRLYDPSLHPPEVVYQVLGLATLDRLDVLQTVIIQAVEDLRPADYVPKTARGWRMYGILYYRFVSNLPQDEVADRVWITPRHLRREQTNAIHLLALKLWEQAQLPIPPEPDGDASSGDATSGDASSGDAVSARGEEILPEGGEERQAPANPENQLKDDLLALQESAPGVISNVSQVVKSVLSLAKRIPAGDRLGVAGVQVPEALNAALHPSALRQVLWMVLHQAINPECQCAVSIVGSVAGKMAVVELAFSPPFALDPQRTQMITEILDVQNGWLEQSSDENRLVVRVALLNVNRKLLVVEDNPDIVHLYQRYLVGTPYYLAHQAGGLDLFERIAEVQPDVIVLDIMLPDVDGWDLLTRLLEDPETRSIPVIVSSVVSDPDLAMALGAAVCLSKPVQRPEFLRALDRVSGQV
jgi:CheY-like chemotaxis protein